MRTLKWIESKGEEITSIALWIGRCTARANRFTLPRDDSCQCEDGNVKELKVVAKDAWGMPLNKEAKRWIDGLKSFCEDL